MKQTSSLLTRLLRAMNVAHTRAWTDEQYRQMPLKSLFGLKKVLKEYNIESEAYQITDKSSLIEIPTPYLAQTSKGVVVVDAIDHTDTSIETCTETLKRPTQEFINDCTGIVMGVYPNENSSEPDYRSHCITEVGNWLKRPVLTIALIILLLYAAITNGTWHTGGGIFLTIVYSLGLYISYLLVLKQLNIHSHIAERVCGIIEQQGCSTVLKTDGSSFFGIVHWCEVGVAYFGVSLLILFLKPDWIGLLSIINICCLPFTAWSVWYQHYRAKAWCTLCLSVQALLWIQFIGDLCFGNLDTYYCSFGAFIIIGLCYLTGLLTINALLSPYENDEEAE